MLVAALSMAFMALLMYLIAVQYAHGALRGALDEAIRVGSPAAASVADCQAAVDRVLEDLLSGPLGDEVEATCTFEAGEVVARAQATFAGWFPGVPDIDVTAEVVGVKESDE
jgi:hypothetical protein